MGCCVSRPKQPDAGGSTRLQSLGGFPSVEDMEVEISMASEDERERLEEENLLFKIEFRLAQNRWRWRVYRTISDFFTLQLHVGNSGLSFWRLWKLNMDSEALVTEEDIQQLRHFLETTMRDPQRRANGAFMQFAEISVFSFEETKSLKEGWISKRRGGRKFISGTITAGVKRAFHSLKRYTKRWFVLRDDHLFYSSAPSSGEVLDVLLLDPNTAVQEIRPERDKDVASRCVWWVSGYKCALKVKNAYRTLVLKFPNRPRMLQWKLALDSAIRAAKTRSVQGHRGHADCAVQVLIDGEEYFREVAVCLAKATTDVFIVGWWLTPDLLLVRDSPENGEHRLMDYLRRAGERGVKIYIVLYSEPSVKLYNDSEFVKQSLEALHSNIQVLSHPARTGANATLFWSHHQKLVVVDHSVVFIGGIDLCLGRFDRPTHRLQCSGEFLGRDFVNFSIRDFAAGIEVRDVHQNDSFIERNVLPRLPWHDVAVKVTSSGLAADVARHFVALWNHIKTDKHKNTVSVRFLKVKSSTSRRLNGTSTASKTGRVKEFRDKLKDIFNKKKKKTKTPNAQTDTEPELLDTDEELPGLCSQPQDPQTSVPEIVAEAANSTSSSRGLQSLAQELKQQVDPEDEEQGGKGGRSSVPVPVPHRQTMSVEGTRETSESGRSRVRFLRSLSWWSFGLPREQSILHGYLQCIKEAREYIYIENQFFIAGVSEANAERTSERTHRLYKSVKNGIADALIDRLLVKDNFRLYIVLPLLPAFQAEPLFSKESYPMRATLLLIAETLRTIRRCVGDEIFQNRVTVHGLKTHELFEEQSNFRSEQIYVHSKVMIVDDTKMIVGSANINDRSLAGNRDSEIAVLIDNPEVAADARRRLWKEHLGGTHDESEIPNSDACMQLWKEMSRGNTEIYDEVFKSWPTNTMRTKEQVGPRVTTAADTEEVRKALAGIRGRIVDYPIDFLADVDLTQPEPVFAKLLPREITL